MQCCSLDLGVRTFATFYSPKIGAGKIGVGANVTFTKMTLHARKLFRQAYNCRDPIRQKALFNAAYRVNRKSRRLRDEMHRKVALWLVTNFDVILMPQFRVQKMISKRLSRRISEKTCREMLSLSHFQFLQLLKAKAEEKGVTVIYKFDEAYTSKTCSCCGYIDKWLGSKEVFKCRDPNCKWVIDRDINGARGIFLKALQYGAIKLSRRRPRMSVTSEQVY